MRGPWAYRAALLALLLVPGGCHLLFGPPGRPKPVPHYFADPRDTASLRRVLLLPFFLEGKSTADPDLVTAIFCRELQKTGRFEVMTLPEDSRGEWTLNYPRRTGRFKVATFLDFSRRFGADAVLFGTVTRFRPYKPPVLGLSVKMISAHNGRSVWESEVLYDMRDQEDMADLRNYLALHKDEEESYHGPEMTLISPRRFTAYVCGRLVERWKAVDASYR